MEVTLSEAVAEDAAAIHEMQTRAFLPLLEKYQDYDTNPANETVYRVVERLNQACVDYYIIRYSGRQLVRLEWSEKRMPYFVSDGYLSSRNTRVWA